MLAIRPAPTMAGMSTTHVDGTRERHRGLPAPTTHVLLDVLCWILNAGNPDHRPRRAEVEVSLSHR